MNELVKELKDEIIEALNLEEMTADDKDKNRNYKARKQPIY